MTWSLEWWPWAIGHGLDPLRTHLLWPPSGFSTVWMTTIPVPALVAAPITLTAGPLVAYNLLMLAAVITAAAAAYLLCYELTRRVGPSVLGGLAFGLSPYMLGHTLSQHLNLTFVFPLPLLVLLGVRYLRGTIRRRRFIFLFSVLLLALVGSSLELFVDLTFLIVVCAAIAYAVARSRRRRRELTGLGQQIGLAYACCLPVLIPIAIFGLSGVHGPLQNAPSNYAVDLLNVVLPTSTLLTGAFHSARAVSGRFVGNIGERDGYVGLPLLVVSLLGLRAEWRRGAWLAGLPVAVALLFSLGPELTLAGRPLLGLPFALARLPLLADVLPARLSVFAVLGLACLCALWLSRPGLRAVRLATAAVVAVSLLPNFWASRRLAHAWATSTSFAWSTPRAPTGFVDDRHGMQLVAPGSNVLVLPTRDRTDADYWQVKSGMRFALAIPETPFTPTQIAADPTVTRLADNMLPQLDGNRLGAARLRAFLLADHVRAVAVASGAGGRWIKIVREATSAKPMPLEGTLVFPVRSTLRPLIVDVELANASSAATSPMRRTRSYARASLHFDGRRAHLRVLLASANPGERSVTTLSSPTGDAEAPAVAVNAQGQAAVAFTEWRNHRLLLRVATNRGAGWRTTTLDDRALPIWSPRVAITPTGTVVAAWIDDGGAARSLEAAAQPNGRPWQTTVTLDNGQGLGAVALRAGEGELAVAAWHDSQASEARIRATIYKNQTWTQPTTLTDSLALLDTVSLARRNAIYARWRQWSSGTATFYQALRRGLSWGEAKIRFRRHDPRAAKVPDLAP
jgi:hypothetical protein